MEYTLEKIFRIVDDMPGSYVVYRQQAGELERLYCTKRVPDLSGHTLAEYRENQYPYAFILEEDRALIRHRVDECIKTPEFYETDFLFRMVHKTKGFIWVHMVLRKFSEIDGHGIYVASLVDVTKETMISYALMESSDRYICVIEKTTKRLLYANCGFYDLVDSCPVEAMGKHCYEILCKSLEMKNHDNCLCYSSINAESPIETYNAEKDRYLTMSGKEVIWGEYDAYVFYLTDVTEQKWKDEALIDSQKRFEVALENSNLMIWEYDMVNHRCITSEKAGKEYNIPLVIENYPESLFDTGYTPPETIEQIKDVKRRLENGETGFSVERRTIDKYGKSNWQKVDYNLECDENGKPVRAIVCGMDINAQKEMEKKYDEEMEYRNKLAQNAMFSIRLDLDADSILDHTCSEPKLENMVQKSELASDFLTHFFSTSVFERESGMSQELLTLDSLKHTYAMGQSQYKMTYRCSLLNLYLDLNLSLYKNPANQHLEVFYVISDVTDNVIMQNAFQSLATQDYDFVAVISVTTGEIKFLAHSEDTVMPNFPKNSHDTYDELMVNFARSNREIYHSEEDFQAVSDEMLLQGIINRLNGADVYEHNVKTKGKDFDVHTFRLSYRYSDASKKQIVFTRANITETIKEEQLAQRKLEDALDAAKKADRAKTDFLARMSHDMRTPMNGIIGMTQLTQDVSGLSAEVQSNLAAIRDSSAYLLSLINDTLDMNKIESNRFTLNPENVDSRELVDHVLATITPLAEQKQIDLKFIPINTKLPWIRTDRIRLQQIFVNILSNAVKFTANGGRINFAVECLERKDNVSHSRIVVEDNGCGMSEEFLKHIFEPFTQEHNQSIRGQEGTGLGMSIVSSLINMMGGRIEIESKLQVGTKVVVYLDFERIPQASEKDNALRNSEANLNGRRVLLVEDHPLNATIAKRLLEKRGVIVDRVENGLEAVQMFERKKERYYDAILMDIRMPVMNGLDAAKKIRSVKHKYAEKIPIIAMTANAYEEDVRKSLEAGMDTHLAKPVEPEELYKVLECFIKSK